MKHILILGGTNFIGRVVVEKLLNNPAYSITLFNRGKRNAGLFAEVPQLHGDREADGFSLIMSKNWDCIIDLSGYYPVSFGKLLNDLKGKVGRYVFVSTISVYDLGKVIGRTIDESEPLLACSEEQKTSALPDAYGEKKAEMERLLMDCEWLDKILLRPSLVYGKYDFTDRFYYWLWRAKFAGQMALPDKGHDVTSITYVNDLADLIIASIDVEKHHTVYNAATHTVSLRQLAETCAGELGTNPELISVSARQIADAGLHAWQDIPLWLNGSMDISLTRVQNDFGVQFTPFNETVKDTIRFYEGLEWPACKAGMKPEQEALLLAQAK